MQNTPDELFAARFSALLQATDWTRKDTQKKLGVSHGTIDNWKSGKNLPVDRNTRQRIETLFDRHEIPLPIPVSANGPTKQVVTFAVQGGLHGTFQDGGFEGEIQMSRQEAANTIAKLLAQLA